MQGCRAQDTAQGAQKRAAGAGCLVSSPRAHGTACCWRAEQRTCTLLLAWGIWGCWRFWQSRCLPAEEESEDQKQLRRKPWKAAVSPMSKTDGLHEACHSPRSFQGAEPGRPRVLAWTPPPEGRRTTTGTPRCPAQEAALPGHSGLHLL